MPRRTAAYYAKHPNAKYWRTKGDQIWAEITRKSCNGCAVCGRLNAQAHHLLSKGAYPQYRHAIEDGLPLCYMHHTAHIPNEISAHGTPIAFMEWLKENYFDKWTWVQEARRADCKRDLTWKESYEKLMEMQ